MRTNQNEKNKNYEESDEEKNEDDDQLIGDKKGSLVLGNKATAPGAELDPETKKYRKGWKVEVNKVTRYL